MSRVLLPAGLIVLFALTARADDKPPSVEGAWREVAFKNGDAKEYETFPDGTVMIDHIVGGRFVWTVMKDGKLLAAAGGRYTEEKGRFTEHIEFVQNAPESFVGSSFDFKIEFDGDTMTKVGTIQVNGQDYKIDEKWERWKP